MKSLSNNETFFDSSYKQMWWKPNIWQHMRKWKHCRGISWEKIGGISWGEISEDLSKFLNPVSPSRANLLYLFIPWETHTCRKSPLQEYLMFIIVKTEKKEKLLGECISRLWCMSYQLKRWSSIYMDPVWKFFMKSLSEEASYSLLLCVCVCVYVHICKVWSHLFQKLIKQNNDLLIFVYVTTWKKSWKEWPPLGGCLSEMWLGGAGWRTLTCTLFFDVWECIYGEGPLWGSLFCTVYAVRVTL